MKKKKVVDHRQRLISSMTSLCAGQNAFDPEAILAEVRQEAFLQWTASRIEQVLLKPLKAVVDSGHLTGASLLDALYTNPEALQLLNNLHKAWKRDEEGIEDEEDEENEDEDEDRAGFHGDVVIKGEVVPED